MLTVVQACDVFGQSDPYLNFFNNCDSRIKQAFTVFNLLVTLLFSASFVGALYCMERLDDGQCIGYHMNQEEIVDWAVLSILIYLSLMLESVGRFVLDVVFEQFAVEMIDQQNLMLYLK